MIHKSFCSFRDNWGRKWSHVVALDAMFYRDQLIQYNMKNIKRELIKAFAGFHTQSLSPNEAFAIATGNWGCGAFHGDRQLKGRNLTISLFRFSNGILLAIIQLIAASEGVRPLIYATYGDTYLVESFSRVYDYLISQRATIRDIYRYLYYYSHKRPRMSLFNFILRTPVSSLVS